MDNQLARLTDAAERIADALERQNILTAASIGMIQENPAAAAMIQAVMGTAVKRVEEMTKREMLRESVKVQ